MGGGAHPGEEDTVPLAAAAESERKKEREVRQQAGEGNRLLSARIRELGCDLAVGGGLAARSAPGSGATRRLPWVSKRRTAANGSLRNDSPPENDKKRVKRPYQTKTFKVELSFAAKIPMSAIAMALKGQESEHTQEAIRVIKFILRQHFANQGCLLVRQSFFHYNPSNFVDLGGGVMGCRGFHSSFRATQSGFSLNIDVSTTMIVKPGPVVDFLLANQKVDHPNKIDWGKLTTTPSPPPATSSPSTATPTTGASPQPASISTSPSSPYDDPCMVKAYQLELCSTSG